MKIPFLVVFTQNEWGTQLIVNKLTDPLRRDFWYRVYTSLNDFVEGRGVSTALCQPRRVCRPCDNRCRADTCACVCCLRWAVATECPASTICDLQLRGAGVRHLWFAFCHASASPDLAFFEFSINLAKSNFRPSVPSGVGLKYSYELQSPLAREQGWFGSLLPL